MPAKTLGERIRQARKAKGMTIDALAAEMKTYPANTSKWESGENKPNKESIWRLSEVLVCNYNWLTTGEEEMTKKDGAENKKPANKTHEELGHRIMVAISDSRQSNREVALKMKIDPATMSRYINGDIGPSYAVLQKIVKFTKCDPAWLLMGGEIRSLAIPIPLNSSKQQESDPIIKMLLELRERDREAFKRIVGEIAMAHSDLG